MTYCQENVRIRYCISQIVMQLRPKRDNNYETTCLPADLNKVYIYIQSNLDNSKKLDFFYYIPLEPIIYPKFELSISNNTYISK